MDILKRRLASITAEAWEEIDEAAKGVLNTVLTARRVLKLNGPKGINYSAVPEGRLEVLEEKEDSICTGAYKVKRLIETRNRFSLNKWELDNVNRGAKDVDLDNLEKAVEELALFEEDVLYNGYEKGDIKGLCEEAEHKMKLGKKPEDIFESISEGIKALRYSYVKKPYDLVVSKDVYKNLGVIYDGYYLRDAIKDMIGGIIIESEVVKGALLLPHKSDDIEFTVGQDFAIGYEKEDSKTVDLYITESFTLRVLDPALLVYFG